jgi:hypothetical protein
MSFLADPIGYTPDAFAAFVATLKWPLWKPKFIVLHNTAIPNLTQWLAGPTTPKQRVLNLNHYYSSVEGWHSGPHLFIDPTTVWNACDLRYDGVHASCFNHVSIGVEMVGDYSEEAFDCGPGAQVRDTTVAALATLHKALGLRPDEYVAGAQGLHFHKECVADHHNCPGAYVDKADIVARILAKMGLS